MFSIHVLAFTLSSVASVQVCVCLKILRRKLIRNCPVVRDNAQPMQCLCHMKTHPPGIFTGIFAMGGGGGGGR